MPNFFQKIAALFKRRPEEVFCMKDESGNYSAYTMADGRPKRVNGPQFPTCQQCMANYNAARCVEEQA